MSDPVVLTPPLTDDDVAGLRAGDRVLITRTMLTGRDAAHKRLVDLIGKGEDLPVDVKGQIIYVVGRTLPVPEPGGGRFCQFTGRPLDGQAIRCSCKSLFALEVAEQLGSCPCCQRPLNDKEEPPPEEIL